MDGANTVQQFRHITVPSLRVVTGLVVSLGLLNGFKAFDVIFVMTGGGPNHASEVLGTYLYSLAFGSTSGLDPAARLRERVQRRDDGAVHAGRHRPALADQEGGPMSVRPSAHAEPWRRASRSRRSCCCRSAC